MHQVPVYTGRLSREAVCTVYTNESQWVKYMYTTMFNSKEFTVINIYHNNFMYKEEIEKLLIKTEI